MKQEEINKIIETAKKNLLTILKNDDVKFESKTFYTYQNGVLIGLVSCFEALGVTVPPSIGIPMMSRRPFIDKY